MPEYALDLDFDFGSRQEEEVKWGDLAVEFFECLCGYFCCGWGVVGVPASPFFAFGLSRGFSPAQRAERGIRVPGYPDCVCLSGD